MHTALPAAATSRASVVAPRWAFETGRTVASPLTPFPSMLVVWATGCVLRAVYSSPPLSLGWNGHHRSRLHPFVPLLQIMKPWLRKSCEERAQGDEHDRVRRRARGGATDPTAREGGPAASEGVYSGVT